LNNNKGHVKENLKVEKREFKRVEVKGVEEDNEKTKQVEDLQIQRNNEVTKVITQCLEIH